VEDKESLLLRQWEMASELHRHMDNMAWQRFNYFTAINGVLLAALGAIVSSDTFNADPRPCLLNVVTAVIPVTGAFVSWVWFLIQKRGRGYHHYRANQARQAEAALKIGGERILTLYQKSLNEYVKDLDKEGFDEHGIKFPARLGRYFRECPPGKWGTHCLVGVVAGFFAILWSVSVPFLMYMLFDY
jgi:hypothetical protein